MQVKVYVPKLIEIPSEYLPALAKRAADSLGDRASEVPATRGHLVRQAIQDGLLREFDNLVGEDGTVDLVCDPGMEIPLELENKTLTLTELLDALQYKRAWSDVGHVCGGGLNRSPSPSGLLRFGRGRRRGKGSLAGLVVVAAVGFGRGRRRRHRRSLAAAELFLAAARGFSWLPRGFSSPPRMRTLPCSRYRFHSVTQRRRWAAVCSG